MTGIAKRRFLLVGSILGLLVNVGAVPFSAANNKEHHFPYPSDAVVTLGEGWNLDTGESSKNNCLDPSTYKTVSINRGDKDAYLTQGNNSHTLNRSLGVSARAALSVSVDTTGFFGGGYSASASVSGNQSLASNFDMTRDDRYVLAQQHHVSHWDSITGKAGVPLAVAAGFNQEGDKDDFEDKCGQGYVSAIQYGGSFYALFNAHQSSYDTAEELHRTFELSASGSAGSVEGSVDVSRESRSKLRDIVKQSSTSIHVLEHGAAASNMGIDVDSVLDSYRTFPVRVNENPAEFRIIVSPYPRADSSVSLDNGPLGVLERELVKWSYLYNLTGKIITDRNNGWLRYRTVPGITVIDGDLDEIQNMADRKIARIKAVSAVCLKKTRVDGSLVDEKSKAACSLQISTQCKAGVHDSESAAVQALKKACKPEEQKNMVLYKQGAKYTHVPIMESDIYYLVKLPYTKDAYASGERRDASPSTPVYNQVEAIYSERCPSKVGHIRHFCESNAKINAAIAHYNDYSLRTYTAWQTHVNKEPWCLGISGSQQLRLVDCGSEDVIYMRSVGGTKLTMIRKKDSQTHACLESRIKENAFVWYYEATCPSQGPGDRKGSYGYFASKDPDLLYDNGYPRVQKSTGACLGQVKGGDGYYYIQSGHCNANTQIRWQTVPGMSLSSTDQDF